MSDTNGYYPGDFNFKLSEECSFLEIQPPPGIKLETKVSDKDGSKIVYAFVVTVKSSTEEEALYTANSEAKRLVDVLAVLSGGHLGYTLRGHNMHSPDGRGKVYETFIGKYNINSSELVDLSQGNFPNLLKTLEPQDKDRRLVERLHHANND
jgi:hypothetical protein